MTTPTVFISYSHDSPEHANRILELANHLRTEGIDATIDQYEDSPAEGWPKWMDRQIAKSDFVLIVCTETYYRRVMGDEEKGKGLGIKWESTLTYQVIYDADSKNTKFIPVLFDDGNLEFIPEPLKGASHYFLMGQYEDLYRRLTNQPKVQKPELGPVRKLEVVKTLTAVPALERKTDFFASGWYLAHPYPMPPNFTGRLAERETLSKWLNEDQEHPLFILRALGGFGKSALTWHWLTHDVNAKKWPKVIWWSFYEGDASFENFLKDTLNYLGVANSEQINPREQVVLLLNLMRYPGIILILDGFERVLRAYGNMGAAYQSDDLEKDQFDTSRDSISVFADVFLREMCAFGFLMNSKVLMTTRLTPRSVERYGQFLQGCREQELRAMDKKDAVEFFHALSIHGTHAEIEAACEPYAFHPLSLRILSGMIINDREKPGDITVTRKLDITDNVIQNKHHMLETAYQSLTSAQQKLLGRIACFRAPMTYDALETIHGSGKGSESFDEVLRTLEKRGLLHWDKITNKYDLHPIVRRYAYEHLTAADRMGAHQQLVNYFAAFPKPTQVKTLEDLAPVIELYHHLVRAGNLDEAMELFYDRIDQPTYYQFGAYHLIAELLRALFLDGEDKPPRLKDESAQAWTLTALSKSYSLSGQPRRAISLGERKNELREKMGDKKNLASGLGNVAILQLAIGALRDADSNLRRYIELSIELGIEEENADAHIFLGQVLSCRGVWQEAEQELNKVLELNKYHVQMQGVTWSHRAQRFLLLARDNPKSKIQNLKSSIECAQRALELADEDARTDAPTPRDYVHAYWLLGAAYRAVSAAQRSTTDELTLAEENLSKALNLCRQINLVEMEADILLDVARLYYAYGSRYVPRKTRGTTRPAAAAEKYFKDALEKASEALVITERCGYVLQGADVNLFLAQYALEQEQDKTKAKQYAETALKLATCDGPPYYYKVAYEEAERLIEKVK
jgi:tetratricopeptide (TPR) repeat protein